MSSVIDNQVFTGYYLSMKKYLIPILCLLLFACGGSDDHKGFIKVTYSVSSYEPCYDTAYVNYMEPGISYYNFKVHLPWFHSFYARPGDYLCLSAKPGEADPNCNSEYELNLVIKKDGSIISQGATSADPNSQEISASL